MVVLCSFIWIWKRHLTKQSSLFCWLSWKKLRFHPTQLNWIQVCISCSSFSILINGSPFGFFFSPNSELKQGDPLSPFLFFLSSDVFSRLMFREQRAGNLKGMQIARNCPAIHHIPFADDLLIFGRANFTEATYQNLFG